MLLTDNNATVIGHFKIPFDDLTTDFEETQTNMDYNRKIEKLKSEISEILGSDKSELLDAYTEEINSLNAVKAEWFYKKGFFDSIENATDYIIGGCTI